ncbi:hypothetical protein, partial [Micrococcus luteus]
HPAPARRRAPLAVGVAALALALAGCGSAGQSGEPASSTAAAPSGSAASAAAGSATESPTDPASAAASRVREALASESAEGTPRAEPRQAFETVGPGIKDGAATEAWKNTAAVRNDTVSVMDCTRDVLDQRTLDAVATHIPDSSNIEIVQLFASQDETHEFLTCVYNGYFEYSPGMPLAQVHYQHNRDGSRLEWCQEEPATVADEYTFDPKTGKGLLALLRPGMVGGQDGAPLLPQRTAWACSEDGSEMVSVTMGSMEGFGDANGGLTQVKNSPVAQSTTLVTETRDHLADTVLKDAGEFQEVIKLSSPFFLNAQMDEETLAKAREIPTGRVPDELLNDQSTIDRPEGAPGPVAPGQPPRPFQGAAREAAESQRAAEASASASASPSPTKSASASASPSPSTSGD